MTPEEAIKYLTPIVESASLPGYKAALGMALEAMRARAWERCEERKGSTALIDLDVERIKLDRTATALGAEELLGQLCEECGELIQAAQKMRRAMKGTTPVSMDDAIVHITEECADVALCIDAITSVGIVDGCGVQFIGRYKCGRWYKRTKEAGE